MQKIKIVSLVMAVLLIGLSYYCYYLVTTVSYLTVDNSKWQNLYQDSISTNRQLGNTVSQLDNEVSNMSQTILQLNNEIRDLNASEWASTLTNLTIYISTDFNASSGEMLQVWNMSLAVGEPFLFTRQINGTLNITGNTTLVGSFLVPHLEGTKATFRLTSLLSFPPVWTNSTHVIVIAGIEGPSTYEVLLDKPFVTLYARVP